MIDRAAYLEPCDDVQTSLVHSQVYHIQCAGCGAMTVRDVNHDTVRMVCPSCSRRLTLAATVTAQCPSCHTDNTCPHTLAGHSTSCSGCGHAVMLGPVEGRAESRKRSSGGHRNSGHSYVAHPARQPSKRTLAFSEGAERSLVLIVAAIATLIFIVVASVR